MSQIDGKVAAYVSDYNLAFNVGADHGVKVGDLATVYLAVEVLDPDTQEKLGTVRHTRLHLEVVTVQAKLSVGRVIDYVASSGNPFAIVSEGRKLVRISQHHAADDHVRIEIGEPVLIRTPSPQNK